jgi:hypothetical protein
MHLLLIGALAVAAPVFGAGLFKLQANLEQWDQQRHAED